MFIDLTPVDDQHINVMCQSILKAWQNFGYETKQKFQEAYDQYLLVGINELEDEYFAAIYAGLDFTRERLLKSPDFKRIMDQDERIARIEEINVLLAKLSRRSPGERKSDD